MKKTVCMAFSIYKCASFIFQDLVVCNNVNSEKLTYSKIIRVSKVKYLGLIFDYNMRWNI